MTHTPKNKITLDQALKNHLNARQVTKKINTLLESKRKKINYRPDYQRNYVWDDDKATFFIESILIGIEIPPLIMFISAHDNKTYEVIDGRQRYETLLRFKRNEFRLSKKGLNDLTGLRSKYFRDLDPSIQQIFLNTTLRTIEFSTIGSVDNQAEIETLIKKEIFWRYNSGITPLKTSEVQRARYLTDNFTELLDEEFKQDPQWLHQFKCVFFASSESKSVDHAECQAKIRELLVINHFPINRYASTTGRRDKIEWLYELYIKQAEDKEAILDGFIQHITWLYQLSQTLQQSQWMIYQGVYWAIVIIEQHNIDYRQVFNSNIFADLSKAINEKLEIFIGSDRGFSSITNQRFNYLANFFSQQLQKNNIDHVDFKSFLKGSLAEQKNRKKDQQNEDINDSITQLNNMRLNRPDAVTMTIEDIIADMNNKRFMIRPSYQRQEVINNKKASGIIESMLIGIPLPSIFIFVNKNGVFEVVDGQQRLLSILAFIGESYIDENNNIAQSKQAKYKLSKSIRVLTDLGGKTYHQLDGQDQDNQDNQDKIQDFELSVVYIDEKINEGFDPIDLFIRLNNKPYPVKDHSFEMWNSYADREFITQIKQLEQDNREWFYYRKDSIRMENEELLSVFAYLSYAKAQNDLDIFDKVDIYNWTPNPLTFRLPKLLITEWLQISDSEPSQKRKDEINTSINDVKLFIKKARLLTQVLQDDHTNTAEALNQLLNIRTKARLQKPFYILWFLLSELEYQLIEQKTHDIATAVTYFITHNQEIKKPEQQTEQPRAKTIFSQRVKDFWQQFNQSS